MSVIARTSPRAYFPFMAAILLRFLALVAMILMPVGMSPAIAAHHAPQAAPAGHCDDMPKHSPAKVDCTMACAAVAPTVLPVAVPLTLPAVPLWTAALPGNVGLTPEAATPPPKHA